MSIFNRGHLFALIAAVAITGCSSTSEETQPAANTGGGGAVSQPVADGNTSAANNLLSQKVVYFDFDKAAIRPDSEEALRAHAAFLASKAGAKVRVEGHADERGTREYNMALGERRAKAIVTFLTANGANAGQLEVVSYGEERPAVDGHDEGSWSQNRRGELVYTAEAP